MLEIFHVYVLKEEDTIKLGEALGRSLKPGDIEKLKKMAGM